MFDNRLLALLNHMIQMPHLSIWKLSVVLNRPVEQLEVEIQELNEVLEKIDFPKIEIKDGDYRISQSLIDEKIKNNYLNKSEIKNRLLCSM